MKNLHFPLFISLILFLTACSLQKPIPPEFEAYIGEWQSDTYVIEIFQNGAATFNSNENRLGRPRRVDGRVRIDEERVRIIGQDEDGGERIRLRIDTPPTTATDSVTGLEYQYMVLDGDELRRTD
jgi:hypothetical protein